MSKPILLFSGGLDSTTLLWQLKPNVKCLLVDYNQRHAIELEHARDICRTAGVEFSEADLTLIGDLLASGSQTGDEKVPEGHYAEESMKKTVVPNRNMIMLAIAIGWAVATESRDVLTAVHAGDHTIYPDCRPEFIQRMDDLARTAGWHAVEIHAPFQYLTKADIVKAGYNFGVPYELTYSCYNGQKLHCGRCGTCTERKEAFQLAGVEDPTKYETR